ncbi:MAG: glycosyltransferase family 39 protein [Anaerolineales bacterium]
MPASNAAENESPFKKRINTTWSILRERLKILAPLRWIFLLAGVISIFYGQHLIEQRSPIENPISQTQLWNDIYKLQIVNFDDAMHALPYLLGGAFLCALFALPSAWKTSSPNLRFDFFSREQFQWKKQRAYLLSGGSLFLLVIVLLARHTYHWSYPFLWIISILAFTIVLWRWDKNANKDLALGLGWVDIFWISALLLLGFIITTYALEDIPNMLIPDEGSFWETARAIAVRDLHPPLFDAGVYTFPVASSIYQGWIVRLCGLNLWAWRFSSVLAGVITVIPLYLLGKEWFNRRVAVTAVVMMIANPYFLSFARMGYNNSQSLFPVTFAIYFFALAARKGSIFYLWLAGILAGVGFYTYSASWLGLMILCLGLVYLLLVKQIKFKQMLLTLSIILLAWGMLFSPRVAYTASGKDSQGLSYKIFETSFVNTFYAKTLYGEADLQQTTPFIPFSKYDTIFYDPVIYRELLLRAAIRTLLALFDPHIVREHFLVVGLAGTTFSVIFFLIGLALAFRSWKQMRFGIQLIWLSAALIFLSIIAAFPPRHTHMVSILPVLALLSGIGLSATIEKLMELLFSRWARAERMLHRTLLALVSLGILYFGTRTYFVEMPTVYPPSFEDIASWIAWKTPPSVHLIYLSEEDIPHSVNYLVNAKMARHTYQSSTFDTFDPQIDLATNTPTVLFLDGNDKELVAKLRKLPFSVPIPYSYKGEKIIGYVVTNTAIDINPEVEWDEGIRSLIATPVVWMLNSPGGRSSCIWEKSIRQKASYIASSN